MPQPARFGWDGGYGTSAYMDPREEDLVAILMTKLLWDSSAGPAVHRDFWTAVIKRSKTKMREKIA